MPASTEELIAINSLLIQREAAFARVHELEQKIDQLLGDNYPFEAPSVALPSALKKKPAKANKAERKAAPFKPRRLNENEVGYRISSQDRGQNTQQELTDLRLIEALLAETLPDMKILKIETIDLAGTAIETLFPE